MTLMEFNNKPWTPKDVRAYLVSLTKTDLPDRQWDLLSRQDWFLQLLDPKSRQANLIDSTIGFLKDCIALGFVRNGREGIWSPNSDEISTLLSEKGQDFAKAWLVADSARSQEFDRLKKWRTDDLPFLSQESLLRHLVKLQQDEYYDCLNSCEPGSIPATAGWIWIRDGTGSVVDLPYFVKDGTLGKLDKDASELAEKYCWTRSGAISFIFIPREVPHILPIQVRRKGRRIHLVIDVSVSPRDVMKTYSDLRSETVTHYREVGKKNTLLAYLALGPWRTLPWADRMKRFNEECNSLSETGSPLYTDLRFFKRDAIDSAKRLLNPFGLTPDIDAKDIEER
jgi:hypothetical protein